MDTRTPADHVAAVRRHGAPVTDRQRADATALLEDLLTAAAQHGVTLDDLGWVVDLPGACLDIIRAKTRQGDR